MSSGIPTGVRATVLRRDQGRCVRCARPVVNVPSSVHHRRPRGMGGSRDPRTNDPRNLVLLCGSGVTGCHGEIESNRARAREDGWLVRSLDDLDVPVVTVWGNEIRLAVDGTRSDADAWAVRDA